MSEKQIPRDRMDLALFEYMARQGIKRGDGAIKGVACVELLDLVTAADLCIELAERYGEDIVGDSGLDCLVERIRAVVSDWKPRSPGYTPRSGKEEKGE